MPKFIDNFLNSTTMYRLVLYYLIFIIVAAMALSFFGLISYNPLFILLSAVIITAMAWLTNRIFSKVFCAQVNVESVYITALILVLIINPMDNLSDHIFWPIAIWASILAIASKYIFAIGSKHIFNPAALGVVLTAFAINLSASWWVGTLPLLPFVIIGGILVTKKILRADLVYSFLTVAIVGITLSYFFVGKDPIFAAQRAITSSPLFFFVFVMLTEPLTTPPRRLLRILYGALVGFLFIPTINIAGIYSTPELALVVGNIFSYFASPKFKLRLHLKERVEAAKGVYDFVFELPKKIPFQPGQYLSWTLAHNHSDSRGSRRYFTIASSPTENEIRMGVKFYENSSSYKKALLAMPPGGGEIVASELSGDFVLPKDRNQRLVFMAGGIGVTPFLSMIKYLLDNNEKRIITFIYSNKSPDDIAYKDVFDEAEKRLGVRVIYTLTDQSKIPVGWDGKIGYVTEEMIKEGVGYYSDRVYYLSGPQGMVKGFEKTLKELGIPRRQIKKDYFPGFA